MKITTLLLTLSLITMIERPVSAKSPKGSAAEQYAAALVDLLKNYQRQLGDKINAEQGAYTAAAKLYDDAFRTNIFSSLQIDRTVDAQEDQRGLESGSLTPDKFMENLKQYAQHDFQQTRSEYELGVDSYSTYIANLDSIQADSQKITALIGILNDLATKPKWTEQLAQIKGYGETFVKQYHLSNCSLNDSLLTIAASKKSAIDARLAALSSSPASSEIANQRKTLTDEQTAAQAEVTRLKTLRDNSGAFTSGPNGAGGKCEVK